MLQRRVAADFLLVLRAIEGREGESGIPRRLLRHHEAEPAAVARGVRRVVGSPDVHRGDVLRSGEGLLRTSGGAPNFTGGTSSRNRPSRLLCLGSQLWVSPV